MTWPSFSNWTLCQTDIPIWAIAIQLLLSVGITSNPIILQQDQVPQCSIKAYNVLAKKASLIIPIAKLEAIVMRQSGKRRSVNSSIVQCVPVLFNLRLACSHSFLRIVSRYCGFEAVSARVWSATGYPCAPLDTAETIQCWHCSSSQAFDLGYQEIMLQTWGRDYSEIVEVGQDIASIDSRVVIKIPATVDGVKAAAKLKGDKAKVALTAVYASHQAVTGVALGADYVAPYLWLMNDAGRDVRLSSIPSCFQFNPKTNLALKRYSISIYAQSWCYLDMPQASDCHPDSSKGEERWWFVHCLDCNGFLMLVSVGQSSSSLPLNTNVMKLFPKVLQSKKQNYLYLFRVKAAEEILSGTVGELTNLKGLWE